MAEKCIRIALAGNPNCGKTTLFNGLTGSNQFVGNWPGVTVEKKEGRLKKHDGAVITDLPGIYSLSPYTLEEIIAREYLVGERPDVILNIVDATNLERNLYLTAQLTELGIPVVVALNMMDLVKKSGDIINVGELSRQLGCRIVEISALKGDGIMNAAEEAISAAQNAKPVPAHKFSKPVDRVIAHIEQTAVSDLPEEQRRWYAVKIFERDEQVIRMLKLDQDILSQIESDIAAMEKELDDDAQSIITNERYVCIAEMLKSSYRKANKGALTLSDKIDKIVTNRWLGLPIFAIVMYLIYYISMAGVGAASTDWTNDGLFGDGWHLFGIGSRETAAAAEEYGETDSILAGFLDKAAADGYSTAVAKAAMDTEADDFDAERAKQAIDALLANFTDGAEFAYQVEDDETLEIIRKTCSIADVRNAAEMFAKYEGGADPARYGVWVPGIPVITEWLLDACHCADWLKGLILDGIVAGVGSVLGFVPQMFVLFLLLGIVESCGYMARIAFVLDRIFRKFGLSGKSFIPMLVGTGCGIPGIMASRTIENERDRRMTIMTTTFIPCGAKVPFIAMIAGAIFGGSALVAASAYFIGMAAIIVSGVMLKKTVMFSGQPSPFVMELPAYHIPTPSNVLRSMWERGWSFIRKAGTVILLSSVVIWFLSFFGWADGSFGMLEEDQLDGSLLSYLGKAIAWIFAPLGWGVWQAAVASVTGLVAKENIVSTMGILYGTGDMTLWQALGQTFTGITGYSFLVFNLLCAPCFAAIGAIRREMNNGKWTWFAIGYQCGFAYTVALMINQFGNLLTGNFSVLNVIFIAVAFACLAYIIYMLFFKKYTEATELKASVKVRE